MGADACVVDNGPPVERCDLSSGILTDDTTNTITFNLSEPDPDFIARNSLWPSPTRFPRESLNALVEGSFPGTGPYVVAAATDTEVRLTRNAHFRVWDAAVRPDGFPNEIVFSVVEDVARRTAMVEDGDADFTSVDDLAGTSPELFARIKTQYAGQLHGGSNGVYYVAMIRHPAVRQRRRSEGGQFRDRPPPPRRSGWRSTPRHHHLSDPAAGLSGYRPIARIRVDPDPGGHWRAPISRRAPSRASSGTAGVHVVVGPVFPFFSDVRDYRCLCWGNSATTCR